MAFEYTIVARPTEYKGVMFRSRLEARYAAFFDLVGWEWDYEPHDLSGWIPDFLVKFKCPCKYCSGVHSLYAEVKPYEDLKDFSGHKCSSFQTQNGRSAAAFGFNPSISAWRSHKDGRGFYSIPTLIPNWEMLWKKAGAATQYKAPPATSNTTIELITPDIAKKYLLSNTDKNRNLMENYVNFLADCMLRGEWMLTGQGIGFDVNGRLINGQHRLHACVRSGVSITIEVTRNLDPVSFRVMDAGHNRTLAFATGIPSKEVAVYRLAHSLVLRHRPRIHANRIINDTPAILIDTLRELLSFCGTNTTFFSSAAMRLATCVATIVDSEHKQHHFCIYRSLVKRDMTGTCAITSAFFKKFVGHNVNFYGDLDIFAHGLKAMKYSNRGYNKIFFNDSDRIKAMKAIELIMSVNQKSVSFVKAKSEMQASTQAKLAV